MSDQSRGRVAAMLLAWQQDPRAGRAAVMQATVLAPPEEVTPLLLDLLGIAGHLVEHRATEQDRPAAEVIRDVLRGLSDE